MLDRVRSNGVAGAGGAGFPTYVKLDRTVDTVILNAAECEPLLHKDKEILRHHMDRVLDGMVQVMAQVRAERGLIAIKEKYEDLIGQLAIRCAERPIEIHPLGDFYPAGDEFVTVLETTGRTIPPGGLPGDVGCLVNNVETLLNVALDCPVTHKYLTVAGDVPEPMTLRVPIGAAFGEVLRAAGVAAERVEHVLVGGVMMGRLARDLGEPVTRTTGGLLCFPRGHGLIERYLPDSRTRDLIGKAACDQCSFCTELCPRYLLGHPVEPHLAMRRLGFNRVGESLASGAEFCCGCNLCSLYACPEGLFPKDACAADKQWAVREGREHPARGCRDVRPHSMRPYRRVPIASLIKKLGLSEYHNDGPLKEIDWRLDQVRIPLRQHVGAPAVAAVRVGDRIQEGQEIGRAPDGLGLPVHASMAGSVVSVAEDIVIRRDDG